MNSSFTRSVLMFVATIVIVALAAPPGSAQAQTTWSGATSSDWSDATNWSNGIPITTANAYFQSSGNSTVSLGGSSRSAFMLVFGDSANSYTFNTGTLALGGTGAGITIQYGSTGTQTFNTTIGVANSSTTTVFRNDSINANLILNGTITNNSTSAGRLFSLYGLGGGVIGGTIVDGASRAIGIDKIYGGGTWTFSGSNTSTSANVPRIGGGATLVLDYTTTNAAKLLETNRLDLYGGNVQVIGNNTSATTTTINGLQFFSSTTAGINSGFSNTVTANNTTPGLTVNLGLIDRNNSGGVIHIRGTANFTGTLDTLERGTIIYNKDYADSVGGIITAYTGYTALPTSGAGSSSIIYALTGSQTIDLGATDKFSALGIKITTTAAGQSLTLTGTGARQLALTSGGSVLFVGDHDYTINASYFGAYGGSSSSNTHWINDGTGILTLHGALATTGGSGGSLRKSGTGTVVLDQGATATTIDVGVGEGVLVFRASDIMGPVGSSANAASVQSGATLQLENNITLPAHTTLALHGLGYNNGGALRNGSGNNTYAGNINLGITSRITSAAGQLNLTGNIDGAASTEPVAIEFDGAGNTRVSGVIGSNVSSGLTKTGSGTLTLTGNNIYGGKTSVKEGTLVVDGNQSSATGQVVVDLGATLSGTGTLGGATLVHGTIAAGDGGAGILSLASGLTLASDSHSLFELNGTTEGSLFDSIHVTGDLTYGGTLVLDLGYSFTGSQQFNLFDFTGTQSGSFTSIQFLDAGYSGNFDYSTGILTVTANVPEPSSVMLLILGGLVAGCIWKRRSQTVV